MVSEIKNNIWNKFNNNNNNISDKRVAFGKRSYEKRAFFFLFRNEKYIFVDYVIFVIIYTKQRNVTL